MSVHKVNILNLETKLEHPLSQVRGRMWGECAGSVRTKSVLRKLLNSFVNIIFFPLFDLPHFFLLSLVYHIITCVLWGLL